MPLKLELHHEIAPLADEWDELADRTGASVFLRPGWFSAWRRAFGRGRLEVIAVRDGRRLVGLAALERGRFVLRSPTNWHTPLWAPLAEDDETLRALTRAIVRRARPWLSLGFVDAGTPALEACRAATASCRTRIYTLERSPYVALNGTWEDYQRRLSAKRRANLNRLWRRLAERGQVEFEVREGPDKLTALLEEGFKVEARGWKGERGTAIGSAPETRLFYEEVAAWAARRGALRLGFLRLDGRALAFDLAVEEGGVHALLKTGFDAAWRSFAPGVLLRERMIEHCFGRGLETYEFLGDTAEWKLEWLDATRDRVAVEAFRPTPAGTVGWVTWAYARPAVRRLAALVRRKDQP
jgi:CelD/BcsL family acetyltransferase involved in cellulose biosynthesis